MLGIALSIGSFLLLVMQGSLSNIMDAVLLTIKDTTTIDLLISINLIQILGITLESEGVIQRIVNQLNDLIGSSKMILFLIPILAALIPGPGVVLLSAPIIEEASRTSNLSGTDKSYINYWFRAAFQASSPITFAFVLATGIAGINKGLYFLWLLPFSVVMLVSGYWHQLRNISCPESTVVRRKGSLGGLLYDLTFIWVVLLLYLGLNLPFSIGILAAIVWVIVRERPNVRLVKEYILKGISLEPTVLILGIMFFKSTVESCGLMEDVIGWFMVLGAPILLPMILLPLLIGLVLGNYAGAVAMSFAFLSGTYQYIPLLAVIGIVARIGVYISPVDSSRLLTVGYFHGNDNLLRSKILKSLGCSIVLVAIYIMLASGAGVL